MTDSDKKPTGRPRKYSATGHDGCPKFALRLSPELIEWVKSRGGAEYVRRLIEEDRKAEGGIPQ